MRLSGFNSATKVTMDFESNKKKKIQLILRSFAEVSITDKTSTRESPHDY